MRPPKGHGTLCSSGLCWHRLVSVAPLQFFSAHELTAPQAHQRQRGDRGLLRIPVSALHPQCIPASLPRHWRFRERLPLHELVQPARVQGPCIPIHRPTPPRVLLTAPPFADVAHRLLPPARIQQRRAADGARAPPRAARNARVHRADLALARVVRRRPRLLRDPLPRVRRCAPLADGVRLAGLAWRGFACDLARVHRAGDQPAQVGYGCDEERDWDVC